MSVTPPTVLSATPAVPPPVASPAQEEDVEEEEEEEEEGEAEGEKGGEEPLPPESTPVPAQLSQNLEVAVATQGKVLLDGGGRAAWVWFFPLLMGELLGHCVWIIEALQWNSQGLD